MARKNKRLLIVDDVEIDRIILKSILCKDFDIAEASGGNMAFDYITTQGENLDAILLDISMPHIDGFDVLKFMADKGFSNIPVFLVTAEPTRDNVERAVRYRVAGFIGKPFDREDVLRRLRSRLGIVPVFNMTNDDVKDALSYISELEMIYKRYLSNFGRDDSHYVVMVDLMRILLTNYNKTQRDDRLPPDAIKLISKAAYFCDIGQMLIPDKRLQIMAGVIDSQDVHQTHTQLGATLIRLNHAKSCEYFVEICSSMCLHHHERFDGKGYPEGLEGESNSPFNQMCALADEFENLRSKFYGDKARPVKFVIRRIVNDNAGMAGPKLNALLENSEAQIYDYFLKSSL